MDKKGRPKVLIATPCFGGMLTSKYLGSMIETLSGLVRDKIVSDFALFTLDNESLISRGRDRCAAHAIRHGFDQIFFIDADISWTYEQFKRLVQSDKDIVGGTYPLKSFPICLNFNALIEHRDVFGRNKEFDDYQKYIDKYGTDDSEEIEVLHIPTGFLRIKCEVFHTLAEKGLVEHYVSFESTTRQSENLYTFFPVRVREKIYESEDWAFCSIAREAGYKIYLNWKIVCNHTGTHHYGLGQHVAIGQKPLAFSV